MISVFDSVENNVEKGENAFQNHSLIPLPEVNKQSQVLMSLWMNLFEEISHNNLNDCAYFFFSPLEIH